MLTIGPTFIEEETMVNLLPILMLLKLCNKSVTKMALRPVNIKLSLKMDIFSASGELTDHLNLVRLKKTQLRNLFYFSTDLKLT